MDDKFIILSDIHANKSALDAVISDFETKYPEVKSLFILGDTINYGMRPNEVVGRLKDMSKQYDIRINIFGNHEKALLDGDTSHFSTDRGRQILDYTRNHLTSDSYDYLKELNPKGYHELEINGRKILFIHGSIHDPFWGKLNETTVDDPVYSKYDYVISGHSHIPHMIEKFYPAERPEYRNKKRTVFLNPGSVGQPRNHNPHAQYLFIDFASETFHFNSVPYDIDAEQRLYTDEIDQFYSDRLLNGI